jgi:hypothetical protein
MLRDHVPVTLHHHVLATPLGHRLARMRRLSIGFLRLVRLAAIGFLVGSPPLAFMAAIGSLVASPAVAFLPAIGEGRNGECQSQEQDHCANHSD